MKLPEEIEKLEYTYQHFQDNEKVHETDSQVLIENTDNTLYPHIYNDIKYGLFENVIDSYYLDSQVRDGFTCNKACYTHSDYNNTLEARPQCTHTCDHISEQLNSLADTTQQHQVQMNEVVTSLFTSDTSTPCEFNVTPDSTELEPEKPIEETTQNNTGIHFHSKHKYRDTFDDAHVQYYDGDAFTYIITTSIAKPLLVFT